MILLHLIGFGPVLAAEILAASENNPVLVGAGLGGAGGLLVLLVRELRRSGEGVWKIVAAARLDTHRARYDLALERHYRDVAETSLRIERGLLPAGTPPSTPHPGPYVEPSEKELKSWA